MKKRILIFCEFYLPGYRSGGGMWTVVNLVDQFCRKYDFFIITRNYESVSHKEPFVTVETGEWNQVRNARVYYFQRGGLTTAAAASLVTSVRPDVILLNSVFGMPGLRFLNARRKRLVPDIPVIVAPCGELGSGALSLKPLKKRLFLRYAKLVRFYRDVIWKASSEAEKNEIRAVMGNNVEVLVAPDLVPKTILPLYSQTSKPKKDPGSVNFVVVSRIMAKKNIHFFLECLREVNSGAVTFDIVGPLEDMSYWKGCEAVISGLPGNVKVNVVGPLEQPDALDRVFRSHFFVLPSLSENFGYVFIEALAAGCPLLISDQTMWNDLEQRGVGWTIPLDRKDLYVRRIKECIDMDDRLFSNMSAASRAFALEWLADPFSEKAMDSILKRALKGSRKGASYG
ncbi:hypothetical protein BH20ACI2_BH20ACI2_20820 [soil metagenome]